MKFECPGCGQHLTATSDQIGQTAPCPACNKPVTVPDSIPLIPQDSPKPTARTTYENQNLPRPATPKMPGRNSQANAFGKLIGFAILIYIIYRFLSPGSGNTSSSGPSSSGYTGGTSSSSSYDSAPISDISWNTINEIYNLKSRYTDLQKDEEWNQFKGKRVTWAGRVASISQSLGSLTMQVKMNSDTFTSDVIVTLKNSERSKAERLRQGDAVTFIATLNRWGTLLPISMSEGEIVE
jgi:hypothetical protein